MINVDIYLYLQLSEENPALQCVPSNFILQLSITGLYPIQLVTA